MTQGAQLPNYGITGSIIGYNNGTNYTQDQVKTVGSGRYVNGVWVPDNQNNASSVPAPLGSNLTAPRVGNVGNVPGYNGANPTSPNSPLSSYNLGSLASSIPASAAPSPIAAPSISTSTVAQAGIPSVPTLTDYSMPATDPAIAALNKQSFGNISSEFNGELPQDVVNQIAQRGAERGISTGVGSANNGAAYLRALGLTSLDLTKQAQSAFQPIQLATISENGDNFRAILGAKSVLDQLNISQAGENSRFNAGQANSNSQFNASQQNDINKQILSGQQAIQQLQTKGQQDIAIALLNATAQQQDTILRGAQAMQQLQLSENGQNARLDATTAADLQKQVLAGQEALQQVNAQGANQIAVANINNNGENYRNDRNNQNNLDKIIMQYRYPGNVPASK